MALTAGKLEGGAGGGGHPEVAGARVEDDLEGLRRSAQRDLAKVLRVRVVCACDRSRAIGAARRNAGH